MPTLDTTPFYQPAAPTVSDLTKFNNLLALLQSTINGLDHSNLTVSPQIPLSALAQNPLGAPLGLAGATAATRYAGATASGAPASGAFSTGDFVIDQTGKVWVCTAAGTPGSWAQVGGGGASAGAELDYKQITASVTGITATTEGTAVAVVTGNSITYDGTKNRIEFFAPDVTVNVTCKLVLLRDGTVLGQASGNAAGSSGTGGATAIFYDTPTAAAHIYKVQAFTGGAQTLAINAGAGGSGNLLPAFLRVTKA